MCQDCNWADALDELNAMLVDERYKFATEFLSSVAEFAEKNEHISPKQWNGVQNVKNSANRKRGK